MFTKLLLMVSAGTGIIKVHCSRKATVVSKKGEILVDGTIPFHGKLIN